MFGWRMIDLDLAGAGTADEPDQLLRQERHVEEFDLPAVEQGLQRGIQLTPREWRELIQNAVRFKLSARPFAGVPIPNDFETAILLEHGGEPAHGLLRRKGFPPWPFIQDEIQHGLPVRPS